ncbi:MAG TPA: hypothetical protein VFF52_00380 [Isosphaeraceae bacterium]|nr:hypothetical protein [Isosphaeraceae bacterium]
MREIHVLTGLIVVLAVPFLAEAMRRGLGRALAATAVMATWLGVTLSAIRRSANPWSAGEGARDYALVMTLVLVLYFQGRTWFARRDRPVAAPEARSLVPDR